MMTIANLIGAIEEMIEEIENDYNSIPKQDLEDLSNSVENLLSVIDNALDN